MAPCRPIRVLLGVALALSSLSYGQNSCPSSETSKETFNASGAEAEVGFELHTKFAAILARVEVNGKPAVMIVDTGSSRTFVSPRIAGLDVGTLQGRAHIQEGSGVAGEARWGKATLGFGPHVFRNHRVVVLDLQDVSRSLGQEIDGLLGQDVLSQFERVVIDFKKRKIALGTRR